MNQERSGGLGDGIRTGVGILAALKEAVEETLDEAIARGDLSPERAKAAMREAAERMQESFGEARERLDLVSRREFEALRLEADSLRRRLDALEARIGVEPATDEGAAVEQSPSASIPVD